MLDTSQYNWEVSGAIRSLGFLQIRGVLQMASFIQKKFALWCVLVITASVILGYFTGPSGYLVPLVTGGMIITSLVKGRPVPAVDKFKSLNTQFLVGFIALTSLVMLVSYLLGFILLG